MTVKKCHDCGRQMITCDCDVEETKRIPYGTVREIAARIPYYNCENIEKYSKKRFIGCYRKRNVVIIVVFSKRRKKKKEVNDDL